MSSFYGIYGKLPVHVKGMFVGAFRTHQQMVLRVLFYLDYTKNKRKKRGYNNLKYMKSQRNREVA